MTLAACLLKAKSSCEFEISQFFSSHIPIEFAIGSTFASQLFPIKTLWNWKISPQFSAYFFKNDLILISYKF